MFNTDKPIEKVEEDLLNRATFSKELANAILSYKDTENFAISLCGEWGCGKTSILNMVVQEINKVAQDMPENEQPIIINFNPWNYSDKNQLITQFFKEIFTVLKKESNNEKLKQAGDALQKYSSVFDYAKYIPKVGEFIALLKPLIEGLGKQISDISDDMDSIGNQKNLVIDVLKPLKQKIIVIIDDIDRLNNEQIRLIFQLVNSVAGFPNMIYLLSFDKSVVVRALSEEQNCDGEEYLEKIIQVPFNVPVAKTDSINAVLFHSLNEIIVDTSKDMFDGEHWEYVFRNCICQFLHSIRDVNRIVNSYKLKYSLMHSETNWADLLCITTLQIAAPEIYNWIKDNIDWLPGSHYKGISPTEQKDNKQAYLSSFETIYNKNPELMLKVIQTLFPVFCWNTGGHGEQPDSRELRYLQRIASPQHSRLYFHLSLDEGNVSRSDVIKSIGNYDQSQLHLYLKTLKNTNCLQSYLQELNCCIETIPPNRIEMFFDAIIKLELDPEMDKKKSAFEPSISSNCHSCIWLLLKRLDDDTIVNMIKNYISNSTTDEFLVLLWYIMRIEHSYGRIGDGANPLYQIISEASLNIIEESCISKINSIQNDYTLIDNNKFPVLKIVWEHLNQEQFNEYMKNCLKELINIPKILLFSTNIWNGTDGSSWEFNMENLTQYMTAEVIYNKLQQLKGTDMFNSLNDEHKQITVAFSLWYETEDKQKCKKISREKVDKSFHEWVKK